MSVIHEPPPPTESSPGAPRPGAEDPTAAALAGIRQELREQGRRIRSTQQAFSIFAVMALLIALASLLAVAFKLDRKQQVVTVAAPAAAVPARAAAPPLARNVDVTLAQFAVTPSDTAAAAGKVTFRVHNAGTIVHGAVDDVIREDRRGPAAAQRAGRRVGQRRGDRRPRAGDHEVREAEPRRGALRADLQSAGPLRGRPAHRLQRALISGCGRRPRPAPAPATRGRRARRWRP